MKASLPQTISLHLVILFFAALTLVPFGFVINNSLRTNNEMYHTFFGLPLSLKGMLGMPVGSVGTAGGAEVGEVDEALVAAESAAMESGGVEGAKVNLGFKYYFNVATRGFTLAWTTLRGYMFNSIIVCGLTAFGVLSIGSITAYILSRYRFPGHRVIFLFFVSTMMFPGVLTLVPLFLLVKNMGLLNSYWGIILPYIAGGQVFAIFVFKSFFDGLPEDLFESARIDGAGHAQLYWNIVLPLSMPVISVVLLMNVFGSWNNFLWPFIVNTEGKYHVVASGLYVMATTTAAQNMSTMFAAYMISSIPLLILFTYATKPFIQGMTSGAFKA